MKPKVDKNKFEQFCLLFEKYDHYYDQYEEAEISFCIEKIAEGLVPRLLKELFNAWFPELQDFDMVEYGEEDKEYHKYGYDAFESLWYDNMTVEELYRYFETGEI